MLESASHETIELLEIREPTTIVSLPEKDLLKSFDMTNSETAFDIASMQKKNDIFGYS